MPSRERKRPSNDHKRDRGRRGIGTRVRAGRPGPQSEPSEMWRRAVAVCPDIDDDWPEYLRALNRSAPNNAMAVAVGSLGDAWSVTRRVI